MERISLVLACGHTVVLGERDLERMRQGDCGLPGVGVGWVCPVCPDSPAAGFNAIVTCDARIMLSEDFKRAADALPCRVEYDVAAGAWRAYVVAASGEPRGLTKYGRARVLAVAALNAASAVELGLRVKK